MQGELTSSLTSKAAKNSKLDNEEQTLVLEWSQLLGLYLEILKS